jgi:hypothetical protein
MTLRVRATLLAGVPLLIMTAIGIALIAQDKPADGRATLVVGVIIAATAGASVIYQIDRWSLRKQSLVHFTIMLATVLPALLLSGWFPLEYAWGYFAVVGVFLAAGFVLWTISYVIFHQVVPRKTATSGVGKAS